jgi:hypothetical protein
MLAFALMYFGLYGYHKVKDKDVAPLRENAYQSCVVDKKPCTKEQFNLAAAHIGAVSDGCLQSGFFLLLIGCLAWREEKYKKELKKLQSDRPALIVENAELRALMPELEPYIEADLKEKAAIAEKEEREVIRRSIVLQEPIAVPKPLVFKLRK